mgnify:CR=1 FL=1
MDTEQLYRLTADDILSKLHADENQKDELVKRITIYREVLATFRQDGTIGDELECHGDKWKYQKTNTKWTYSKDLTAQIKKYQQLEQAEGIATKSVSYGWKRYPHRPKF